MNSSAIASGAAQGPLLKKVESPAHFLLSSPRYIKKIFQSTHFIDNTSTDIPNDTPDKVSTLEIMDDNPYAMNVKSKIDRQAIVRLQDLESDWPKWINPVDEKMTVEILTEKHEKMKMDWEASIHYRALIQTFEETVLKQKKLSITACMFLGLGSMNCGSEIRKPIACDRSMMQLVVWESLISLLSESSLREQTR